MLGMNHHILTVALLACLASAHLGQASEQERINKTFRELRRLPDGTTEVSEALPIVKTLVRLDPEHGGKYFNEYLDKIVPEGRLSASQAIQEAAQVSISVNALFASMEEATKQVKKQLQELQSKSNITIEDMFKMQMMMNRLSQLSEMSSAIVSASNSAISSMARNVKN
jgi:hypothetical protein